MVLRILTKVIGISLSTMLIINLVACSESSKGLRFRYQSDEAIASLITEEAITYPATKFIVFSDPHVFSSELGTEGTALDDYLAEDRKLLRESERILKSLVETIKKEVGDFVIIPGDLTKDGERICHELTASYLQEIEESGKQVFVVPGNHDILNPHAYKYEGEKTIPVSSVTPGEFMQIYKEYGFGEALYLDANSLSYVIEPQVGLWLMMLDACRYEENAGKESPVTDGAFDSETFAWIEQMLIKAKQLHKAVIVTMHHNVTEHYKGQEKYFGEYIVDNYQEVQRLFTAYDARLVFTGHYHAQDITVTRFPGENNYLLDIETGSLVTYPCPYRLVEITQAQELTFRSGHVTDIDGYPAGFQDYAWSYVESGLVGIAADTIEDYGVKPDAAEKLARQVSLAFMAHYAGDEDLPDGQAAITSKGTGFRGWLVVLFRRGMVKSLWQDLPPADNSVDIDLRTGELYYLSKPLK